MKAPFSLTVLVEPDSPPSEVYFRTADGLWAVLERLQVVPVNATSFDGSITDGVNDKIAFSAPYEGPTHPIVFNPGQVIQRFGRPVGGQSRLILTGYFTDDRNQT